MIPLLPSHPEIPLLCFPHVSHLWATPSSYSHGSRCSTVTLPLSLPSPLPAWLNVAGGKRVLASAVSCLQINSVTPPVKYMHQGKPKPRYLHVAFDVEGKVYNRAQGLMAPVPVPGVKT